jgi:hypothetical protein
VATVVWPARAIVVAVTRTFIPVLLRTLACTKARVGARAPGHPGRVTCGDAAQSSGVPSMKDQRMVSWPSGNVRLSVSIP